MLEPTIDVVGIGNALVDVISHETPEFIAEQGLIPGSMNLIDEERRESLYGSMGVAIWISSSRSWVFGKRMMASSSRALRYFSAAC